MYMFEYIYNLVIGLFGFSRKEDERPILIRDRKEIKRIEYKNDFCKEIETYKFKSKSNNI
jgi:hypothetical protein